MDVKVRVEGVALSGLVHTVHVVSDLSDKLRAAAAAERMLVAKRVDDLREQARRLRECAESVEADLATNTRLLHQLDEMLGNAPQLSMTPSDETLRGHRLRDVAIQVLKSHKSRSVEGHEAVHYREWYELVVHDGHRVAGKDPVATFLTQVSRAPEIERVGRRTGLYRLRAA